jgi:hypothetical protein
MALYSIIEIPSENIRKIDILFRVFSGPGKVTYLPDEIEGSFYYGRLGPKGQKTPKKHPKKALFGPF